MKHLNNNQILLRSGAHRDKCPVSHFGKILAFAISGMALLGGQARAANATWNGTTNALWSTGTNWSGLATPGNGNTATFSNAGNGRTTITVGNITLGTVQFNNAATAAYTLGATAGSGSIRFANATLTTGVNMTNAVTTNQIINANIVLGLTAAASNTIITNDSTTGLLTLGGTIAGGTTGTAAAKTLTVSGAGNVTINGAISDGGATSLVLTKSGAGTLGLGVANSYTGLTTISEGTLKLGNASALGTTAGSTTLSGTGILDLNGQTITGETLTGIAAGASLINNNTGAAAEWTGGISTMANGASIGGAGNLTLSGVVASTGNNPIVKTGAGTLFLTNNGNTFTLAVTISQGVVNISANNALGAGGSGTNSVTAGAALQMQGGITTNATAGKIDLTLNGTGVSNDGALRNISGNNIFSHQITLGSSGVRINSDAGLLTLPGGINGTNTDLTVGGANNTTVSGAITTGTGTLTKDGAGTLELSNTGNNYAGTTQISGGTLLLGASDVLPNTPVTLSGGTLATNGNDDTAGVFSLTAASTIDLGTTGGGSVLTFTSTSSATWLTANKLTVWGWTGSGLGGGSDQLIFNSHSGLPTFFTSSQVQFYNNAGVAVGSGARFLPSGELVPVPEASTVAGIGLLLGLVGWRERKYFLRRRELPLGTPT